MTDKLKKMWKYCGLVGGEHQWLRTHLFWLRAGDYFKIEGSDLTYMATSDPYNDPLKGPSIHSVDATNGGPSESKSIS